MVYYLGKLTQLLIAPLNVVLVLLVVAILIWRRWPKMSNRLLSLATLWLLVASLPITSFGLFRLLEDQYPMRPIAELPDADAIVVLGGTVVPLQPPRMEAEEITGARLQRAIRLYLAEKAPVVVCCGGGGYPGPANERRTEADDMQAMLRDFGVPETAIRAESRSRNTSENARYGAEILEKLAARRVLLVTSAFHMPRAVALFEREGVEVIPAPSDPRATGSPWTLQAFRPGPYALRSTTLAINEIVGYWGYRLLGLL